MRFERRSRSVEGCCVAARWWSAARARPGAESSSQASGSGLGCPPLGTRRLGPPLRPGPPVAAAARSPPPTPPAPMTRCPTNSAPTAAGEHTTIAVSGSDSRMHHAVIGHTCRPAGVPSTRSTRFFNSKTLQRQQRHAQFRTRTPVMAINAPASSSQPRTPEGCVGQGSRDWRASWRQWHPVALPSQCHHPELPRPACQCPAS